MAIDIDKSDLPEPAQLRLDIEKLVRWIFGFGRQVELRQKSFVQASGRGRNVLQIQEDSTRIDHIENFRGRGFACARV